MNGDSKTGVTIMKILPKQFDIGEVTQILEFDVENGVGHWNDFYCTDSRPEGSVDQ